MAEKRQTPKEENRNAFLRAGKTTRRNALKVIGLGSLSLALPGVRAGETRPACREGTPRPNVLLIVTDDQGYGDLSCHGNPVLRTPHLDRLHAQSVRFANFHVDPTCSPTRASLLTGRFSSRAGVWHTIMGRSLLAADETTMADLFSANGYRTGIFGKWQKYSGYCTDVFFEEAMKFMISDPSRPFFVYLATNTPHWPHHVAEAYTRPNRDVVPERMAAFYGMIANIDENIGHLLEFLKERGLEEDTLLVFLTDNGTSFGAQWNESGRLIAGYNAGMRGHKGSIYEGGHRVPCFIRWPRRGITGGRDVHRLSAHIDLLPTLVELCGLEGARGLALDGKSLVPLLEGRESAWPERTLFVHNQRVDFPIKGKDSAVMTDRWRLINGRELYDVIEDPGQERNLAAGHPRVVRELKAAYDRWWKDISARFEDYAWILIGSPQENPVKLTSHDIHGQVGWDQVHVLRNARCDGFWAVEFIREGLYEIRLMRWPEEAGIPILKTPEGATEMRPSHARLKVAALDLTRPVREGDRSVDFKVRIPRGKTRLQAWFIDGRENGKTNAAFYVYVRRLD